MIQIRRILCPVDFSETSQHALEHAVAVAKWYESRIVALHVVHAPPFPLPPILAVGFADAIPPTVPSHQMREEDLRSWLEPAHRAGVTTEVIVDDGNASDRIVERVKSETADLVVMGTHGLRGFERFMLGSVAEKVVRKAACPVMTVPPAATTTARVPYTSLLCPVDFSESSLAALRYAFSLAQEADAKLTILHVLDWPPDNELLVEQFDGPEFRELVEEQARKRLDALVTDEMKARCKPTTRIGYGKPYRHILDTAQGDESDLIVIGIHGRNPVDVTLFGSTTNQVVRRASCPVLTLKQ